MVEILSSPGSESVMNFTDRVACSIHDVIETPNGRAIYPYRCYVCGKCFLCGHKQVGYEGWECQPGMTVSSEPSPGVPVHGNG